MPERASGRILPGKMKNHRLPLVPILLTAWLTGAATAGETWRDKIHPSLEPAGDESIEFMVVLKDRADLAGAKRIARKEDKTAFVVERLQRVAAETQPPLIARLEALGAEVRPFWIVNALWVRGNRAAVEEMARREDVERIDANPKSPLALPERGEATRGPGAIEWNVSQVGADQVWALGYDGTGIVVGSQDTGFFWDHPALISSYRGWNGVSVDHNHNWHDAMTDDATATPTCLSQSPVPCDDGFLFPHGTYTMGVTVGDDGGTRRTGVSPGAKWMGCRSIDLVGGTPATYTECFQWLVAPTDLAGLNPDPSLAPHVINNSWACIPAENCNPDTLLSIVQNVRAAGIVVVAAAGNDGTECETIDYPPAIYDETFTVGATDSNDFIGAISSRGPVTVDGSGFLKPDITAPGINVTSAVGIWDFLGTGEILWDYAPANGTSAASPHVVGAVALLLQARPDLIGNVEAIETLLRDTALELTSTQPCGGLGPADTPNNVFGHGRLDLVNLFVNDADLDGTTNVHDCAIDDNSAWSLAGDVADLTLSGKPNTTLSWSQPADVGASSFAYDVLRSDAAGDFSAPFCVGSGQAATTASDSATPAQVAYYLVSTVNPCGASPGHTSAGALRNTAVCP